jgi:hypothetical protein
MKSMKNRPSISKSTKHHHILATQPIKKNKIGMQRVIVVKSNQMNRVKIEELLSLKMEVSTQANGKENKSTVRELKNGQMVQYTRVNGKMTKRMEQEHLSL